MISPLAGVGFEAVVAPSPTIVERRDERGAHGIILGCTEISMLVGPQDASVPLFDMTAIHADAAAEAALGQDRAMS